jgi:general secretion pathway protein G
MTLIEIMVVIAILVLIAGAVGVRAIGEMDRARVERAQLDIKSIESALQLYYAHKGTYPDARAGLQSLVETKILPTIPKDPWGREYLYALNGSMPRITCLGRDGQPGGDGIDADLSN